MKLQKKRAAERLRYERIKNDPIKNEELREKERRKYLNKKQRGIIKSIADMTPKEQKARRRIWVENTRKRRDRLALLKSVMMANQHHDQIREAKSEIQQMNVTQII